MATKQQFIGISIQDIQELEVVNSNEIQKNDMIDGDTWEQIKDDQMKQWTDPKFKKLVQNYMKNEYQKEYKEISDQFSFKIWNKMYEKNIRKNNKFAKYQKVLYHPNVTTSDYNYINEKIYKQSYVVVYSQIFILGIGGIAYAKSNKFQLLKDNLTFGLPLLGALPLVTMSGTWFGYQYLLNRRLKKTGMYQKYNVK